MAINRFLTLKNVLFCWNWLGENYKYLSRFKKQRLKCFTDIETGGFSAMGHRVWLSKALRQRKFEKVLLCPRSGGSCHWLLSYRGLTPLRCHWIISDFAEQLAALISQQPSVIG